MPEGDTLRKLADHMAPRMVGRTLVAAHIAGTSQPELARRSVVAVRATGKHLLFFLGTASLGWRLRVHLGMYGSWHSYPQGAPWRRPKQAASVVLQLNDGNLFVCFYAQDVDVVAGHGGHSDDVLRRLGPNLLPSQAEPGQLQPSARADVLAEVLQRARVRARCPQLLLIDLLLDQSVAAGFGNVYKSELMFFYRCSPTMRAAAVGDAALAQLYRRGMQWLAANLGGWPRTTTIDRRYFALPPGQPRLYVYGRAKEPCLRCNTPIVRSYLGRHRRSTYACPACQAFSCVAPQS